jgi:hypothetical protein
MSAKPTRTITRSRSKRLDSPLSAGEKRELAALAKMPDSAIDFSDIPEITDWSRTQVGRFYRPAKSAG